MCPINTEVHGFSRLRSPPKSHTFAIYYSRNCGLAAVALSYFKAISFSTFVQPNITKWKTRTWHYELQCFSSYTHQCLLRRKCCYFAWAYLRTVCQYVTLTLAPWPKYACGNVKFILEPRINEASQEAKLINNDSASAQRCIWIVEESNWVAGWTAIERSGLSSS